MLQQNLYNCCPLKVFEEAVRAVLRPEPQKRRQRKCIVM